MVYRKILNWPPLAALENRLRTQTPRRVQRPFTPRRVLRTDKPRRMLRSHLARSVLHSGWRISVLGPLLLSGCAWVTAAERPPIDCSIAKPDNMLNRCGTVRRASEFTGCIKASEFTSHSCLLLDTDAQFCSDDEPFPISVILDRSDVALDCADQTIDHGWTLPLPESADDVPTAVAASVAPVTSYNNRFPAIHALSDRSLDNVTIRNCGIARTGSIGINFTRFFGGQLEADGLPEGHSNIRIEDVNIDEVITGVFIGTYSRNVTMDRLVVNNTQRIAIYSEAGSHGVKLRQSVVSNNQTREALALDSTYDSEVSDTLFVNNREGAINLYQNCGELKGIVCPVIRSTPPNNNKLIGNSFVHNGVSGIQIASRQGRNHSLGWCATLNGFPGKHRDTADNNVVENNTFVCNSGIALRVMDGPNRVEGNQILARRRCIPLEISTGGLGRSASDRLDGIVIQDNDIQSRRLPRLRNVGDGVTFEP